MDIDSAPDVHTDTPLSGHSHLNLPSFSSSFPLPFRVLFLVGLAQLLWATNLHILHKLGLDTSWILDFRDATPDEPPDGPLELDHLQSNGLGLGTPRSRGSSIAGLSPHRSRPESAKLYGPVYKLFLLYTGWVGGGWLLFRTITGGEAEAMERWRGLVGLIAVGAAMGAVAPWRGLGQRERPALRRYVISFCRAAQVF